MELNGNVGYMTYVVPANTPHMHMGSVTHCMLTVLNCQLPTTSSWTWVCIPILSMSHALNQFPITVHMCYLPPNGCGRNS